MWVVRNINGTLELSHDKPHRSGDDWMSSDWIGFLKRDLFPNLKFEDGPIEVLFVIKKI